MFDPHPPFQIDGNFGGAAGIAEMLMQSRPLAAEGAAEKFEIDLLPALPIGMAGWQCRPACARAAVSRLDLTWDGGKLTGAKIKSAGGRTATVRYGDRTAEIKLNSGGTVQLNSRLQPAS